MTPVRGFLVLALAFVLGQGHFLHSQSKPATGGKPPKEKKSSRTDLHGDPLPPGAIARLGTVRLRDSNHVDAVVFSPNGKTLASGGWSGAVHFWESGSGKLLRAIKLPAREHIRSLAFSPDGKILAVGGSDFGPIYLLKSSSGKQLCCIRATGGRDRSIRALTFAPNGKTIASGSGTGEVCLWDLATGKRRCRLGKHQNRVNALAFSPDGKILASGGEDKTVRLWEVASRKELYQLPGHERKPVALAFHRNATTLMAAIPGDKVRFWKLATRKAVRQFGRFGELKYAPTFSPNGKLVAAGGTDGTIRVWRVATGKQIRQLNPNCRMKLTTGLAFSPSGKALASLHYSQTISLWNLTTGREISLHGHREEVRSVAFVPGGKILVSGGDWTVRLWEASSGKQLGRFGTKWGRVKTAALSPDGKMVATAGSDFCLWDIASGKKRRRFPAGELPRYEEVVAFAPNGKILVTAGDERWIKVWDVSSGKLLRRLKGFGDDNGMYHSIIALAFSASGKVLTSGGEWGDSYPGYRLSLWEVATGKELVRINEPQSALLALALSPDGRLLAAAGNDGIVRLWDGASGKLVHSFEVGGAEEVAYSVAFSTDNRVLAVGAEEVSLWEVATRKLIGRFPGQQGIVHALAFSANGRRLVLGGANTTILVWDATGKGEPCQRAATKFPDKILKTLVADLASDDTPKARRAVWALAAAGNQAVPLLKTRLHPAVSADPERLKRLITELGSNSYRRRQKASRALGQFRELAEPALHRALRGRPIPEVRRRVKRLLKKLTGPVSSPEQLYGIRGVEVLERVGSIRARRFLKELTQGAPEARLTREAKAALKRLGRRLVTKP